MNESNATEDRLRSEIEGLKRQIEEQKKHHAGSPQPQRVITASTLTACG